MGMLSKLTIELLIDSNDKSIAFKVQYTLNVFMV